MFNLNSITLNNFRLYVGEHTFKFPTVPGLYSLTGKNLDNPRLGANGAGKSTFLDAIYWAFYGRTSRGLRGADVISRKHKSCSVSVNVTIGAKTSIITRQQSPNALEIDGKPCDQETLQKFLRLSPDAFLYAVMIPQFGEAFFDLGATAKLTLFSQIMELDHWLERSKIAATLADEINDEAITRQAELTACDSQIELIKDDILDLDTKSNTFASARAEAIKKLEIAKNLEVKNISYLEKDIEKIKVILRDATARITTLEERVKTTQKETVHFRTQLQQAITASAVTTRTLSALRKQLDALKGLKGECPTCLQTVSAFHLQAENTRMVREEKKLQAQLMQIQEQSTFMAQSVACKEKDIEAIEDDLLLVRKNHADFTGKLLVQQQNLQAVQNNISNFDQHIKREISSTNPYENMLVEKQNTLRATANKFLAIKKEVVKLDADHQAVSYWVNGFKKIRLFIINDAIQQLELEINNNLASLGLLDWTVKLDVERENKSGGVTKGFVVMVYTPGVKEPVRFESWSGGETQRLRLAGDFGLANLIMQRAGLDSTIEFYDEPSKHLSQEGLLDLAETLYARAISSQKRILLVDHHNIDFGDYAGRIVAVRDSNGSRLTHDD